MVAMSSGKYLQVSLSGWLQAGAKEAVRREMAEMAISATCPHILPDSASGGGQVAQPQYQVSTPEKAQFEALF